MVEFGARSLGEWWRQIQLTTFLKTYLFWHLVYFKGMSFIFLREYEAILPIYFPSATFQNPRIFIFLKKEFKFDTLKIKWLKKYFTF